jgi:hypothetical protein
MAEVGREFTLRLDMGDTEAVGGSWGIGGGEALMKQVEGAFEGSGRGGLRQAVVAALASLHQIAKATSDENATKRAVPRLSFSDYTS